jgi:hypothetical protein
MGRSPGVRSDQCLLLTSSGFWIEGKMHVPEELLRFSDAWEALVSDPRAFIPITEATVKTLDGKTVVATSDLIEVRKDHITVVLPGEP